MQSLVVHVKIFLATFGWIYMSWLSTSKRQNIFIFDDTKNDILYQNTNIRNSMKDEARLVGAESF